MEQGKPEPPTCQFIVNYCCKRVLLYAKMQKETETEKRGLFCHSFIIGVISIGGGAGPLATPMSERWDPGTVLHSKSGPGYCIAFIKR